MDFVKIKNDYQSGVSVAELARRYSVSAARIRYRARKENWRSDDASASLRSAVLSTARMLLGLSLSGEETLRGGGKIDPKDVKYLTAAEKELSEVIRSLGADGSGEPLRENGISLSGENAGGLIFIPSIISGEA